MTLFCSPEPWMEKARCRGVDNAIFFPPIARGQVAWREYKRAVAICKECAVDTMCLAFAIRSGELEHGVYGGKTPQERQKMLGKYRAKKKKLSRS